MIRTLHPRVTVCVCMLSVVGEKVVKQYTAESTIIHSNGICEFKDFVPVIWHHLRSIQLILVFLICRTLIIPKYLYNFCIIPILPDPKKKQKYIGDVQCYTFFVCVFKTLPEERWEFVPLLIFSTFKGFWFRNITDNI